MLFCAYAWMLPNQSLEFIGVHQGRGHEWIWWIFLEESHLLLAWAQLGPPSARKLFGQPLFVRGWLRCQTRRTDAVAESRRKVKQQGRSENLGIGTFHGDILECWCPCVPRRGKDVDDLLCLRDVKSNLNMMKLIWFYRLEFLSDTNGWGLMWNIYLIKSLITWCWRVEREQKSVGNASDLLEMKLGSSFLGKNWILWSCFYTCCA